MADQEKQPKTEEGNDAQDTDDHDQKLSEFMSNPQVLQAIQDRLNGRGLMAMNLHPVVKRRIKALKKLQKKCLDIESKFYEEVHALECKYASQYDPLYEKRKDILCGVVEPTDSDCEWASEDEEEDDALAEELKKKMNIGGDGDAKTPGSDENAKGVPEFWLQIFRQVDTLSEMLQEHDEPILRHLEDIKVKYSDPGKPMSFELEFLFSENEFFANRSLTKVYVMRAEPDETDPLSFEGPEIIKCNGCKIDWKKGKDVTVKVIKKRQKHKSKGSVRTIEKKIKADSFFNFFDPPIVPSLEDGAEEMDEETEQLLAADFEIGHFFRDRIIPRAVLYFTGEALEEDDDYDEEEEDEDGDDEDDDDDDDDEDDDDDAPKKGKKGQVMKGDAGKPGEQQECKQQ
jgi:nucleosome assembly protein 1-like 1